MFDNDKVPTEIPGTPVDPTSANLYSIADTVADVRHHAICRRKDRLMV